MNKIPKSIQIKFCCKSLKMAIKKELIAIFYNNQLNSYEIRYITALNLCIIYSDKCIFCHKKIKGDK